MAKTDIEIAREAKMKPIKEILYITKYRQKDQIHVFFTSHYLNLRMVKTG